MTRRANTLVLLDKGMSCQDVAEVLLFDDDTIRGWYELFEQGGFEGLSRFDMGGSSGKMSAEQCDALKGLGRDDPSAVDAPDRRLDRQRNSASSMRAAQG